MLNTSTFTGLRAKGFQSEPGFLVLKTAGGTDYYLWIDSTGDLRVSATKPTNYDADGTIVGTQS